LLTIKLDEIEDKGLSLEGETDPSDFPQLVELAREEIASFPEPIHYRIEISRLMDLIEVKGHVSTELRLACGRCLDSYQIPFSSDFLVTYSKSLPDCFDDDDEETELSAEEMGMTLISGEELSLLEPLQEQLLIALPVQPLCSRDCKGLCPFCGDNLNLNRCDCTEESFDTRFAALKNFKVEE